MPETKRIVILANSKKHLGSCVAGIDLSSGTWIRPVSDRPNQEVSDDEQRLTDRSLAGLLDVVDVPLLTPHPAAHQPENWLLDPERTWTRAGALDWGALNRWATNEPLWSNVESTYHGINDLIPPEHVDPDKGSLRLVSLERLGLKVLAPGSGFGNPKRRVLAHFNHNGARYALWVTDPVIEQEFLAQPNGEYRVGRCYVTVSLGELYRERHSKLVAAVIREGV